MPSFSLNNWRLVFAFALSVLALPMGGCSPEIYRYRSRLVSSLREAPREVTETPTYTRSLRSLKNVTVSAPDSCINQTAAATTGSATQTASVLTTRCGVEMAEIERALTRAGYSVTSWLHQHEVVRDEKVSAIAAARKLGAEVLFQVNSLEKVMLDPGHDTRWERWYEVIGRYGVHPAELPERDRAALRDLAANDEKSLVGQARFGAMLDVNAIAVDTGQTIWFYRWSKVQPLNEDRVVTFNAAKSRSVWSEQSGGWFRVVPETSHSSTAMSREVESLSSTGQAANEANAIYFQLMRDVINDFVTAFSNGRSENGQSGMPARPMGPPQTPTPQPGHPNFPSIPSNVSDPYPPQFPGQVPVPAR